MSEWLDRIKNHKIYNNLQTLDSILNDISISEDDQPEIVTDIERLKNVSLFINRCLNNADPFLLSLQLINSINNSIKGMINEINNFKANRNRAHLVNANNNADAALSNNSIQLFMPNQLMVENYFEGSLNSYREASINYLKELENRRKKISSEFSSLENKINEVINEISNQKGRLDSAIIEYQQQFSQSENLRLEKFSEAQNNRNQKFEMELKEIEKNIQEIITDFEESSDKLQNDSKETFNSISVDLKSGGESITSILEEYRQKAQSLLHVIGSTGMAGEYQKVADNSQRSSIFWQRIAIISMIGLIAFAIWTFFATQAADIKWGNVAGRIFVTVAFGILAAYGVRQADKFSNIEMTNRRYQLELSSIDPYLVGLPQDIQDNVKVELCQKLFGNKDIPVQMQTKEMTGSIIDILQMILKFTQDIKR
jgi:hypothetical protein